MKLSLNVKKRQIYPNYLLVAAAQKTAKNKKKWLKSRSHLDEIRTPDQLDQSRWQYRLSITVGQDAIWSSDDSTLRLEALKGIEQSYSWDHGSYTHGQKYSSVIDCTNKVVWSVLIDTYKCCAVIFVKNDCQGNIDIVGKSISPALSEPNEILWKSEKITKAK